MNEPNRRWSPDFLGIGAMKAATYWLHECLYAHPEICMGSKKEVHYFDRPSNYRKGADWYESFFSHCGGDKKQGEITPGYISTPGVANLIKRHYPDVKLFACLRNPVERAYSHYRFNVLRKGNMVIYDSFEDAVDKDPSLIEMGMYFKQLTAFYGLFRRDNLRIFLYDDICENPVGVLKDLYSFLGVDDTFTPAMVRAKKGVTGKRMMEYKIPFLNPMAYRLWDHLRGGELGEWLARVGIKQGLRNIVLGNRRIVDVKAENVPTFPPIAHETYGHLLSVFERDIKALEELIARDLGAWSRPSRGAKG